MKGLRWLWLLIVLVLLLVLGWMWFGNSRPAPAAGKISAATMHDPGRRRGATRSRIRG